jgi:hypothetical protein
MFFILPVFQTRRYPGSYEVSQFLEKCVSLLEFRPVLNFLSVHINFQQIQRSRNYYIYSSPSHTIIGTVRLIEIELLHSIRRCQF